MRSRLVSSFVPGWRRSLGAVLVVATAACASGRAVPPSPAAPVPTPSPAPVAPSPTVTAVAPRPGVRGWLGVELEPGGAPGVGVFSVVPGSPAASAGLLAGDRLVSIGGEAVATPPEVVARIGRLGAGAVVPLVVIRDGQRQVLDARLIEPPDPAALMRSRFAGRPAPPWVGVTDTRGEVATLDDFAGRVLVLEFWATWCVACRALQPILNDWHDEADPQQVAVVGVLMDEGGSPAPDAQALGVRYGLVADTTARTAAAYGARALPTVFLIDRDGRVDHVMVGLSPAGLSELRARLDTLRGTATSARH